MAGLHKEQEEKGSTKRGNEGKQEKERSSEETGLPNDLSVYWHQYPYSMGVGFCKFRALFSETSSYVSVLTIVAFSMERYLAICHPLHLYAMSGLKRACRIIAALWIISLIAAAPFAVYTTINYLTYPPSTDIITTESAFCAMLVQPSGLTETSSLLFFFLPMLVILVLYVRMGLRIRSRSRNSLGKGIKGSIHGESRQNASRRAVIRMLAAVVIAFFLSWAPFHAQRVLYIHAQEWTYYKEINEWLFSIAGWLYYVSSTVNPILYNVMSNRYRVAFKEVLCGHKSSPHNGSFATNRSSYRETSIGDNSSLMRNRSRREGLQRGATSSRRQRYTGTNGLGPDGSTQGDALIKPWRPMSEARSTDENFGDVIAGSSSTTEMVVLLEPTSNGRVQCYLADKGKPNHHNHGHVKWSSDTPDHTKGDECETCI